MQLAVEAELVDSVLDRQPVNVGKIAVQWIVRTLEPLACVVAQAIRAVRHQPPELLRRALLELLPDEPAGERRGRALRHLEPVAADFRPDVGLVPVHPRAAQLDLLPAELERPGTTSDTVPALEQHRAMAGMRQLSRGGDSGEAAPDNDDVVFGFRQPLMTKNFLKGCVMRQVDDCPLLNEAMSPGFSVTESPSSTSIVTSPSSTWKVSSPGKTYGRSAGA